MTAEPIASVDPKAWKTLSNNSEMRPLVIAAFRKAVNDPKAIIEGIKSGIDEGVYIAKVKHYRIMPGRSVCGKYERRGLMKIKII